MNCNINLKNLRTKYTTTQPPPKKKKNTVVSLISSSILCCALLQALDVALHASCSAMSRIANSFVAKWPLYRGGRDGEKVEINKAP